MSERPSVQVYNSPEKAGSYHAGLQAGSIRARMLQVTAQALMDSLPSGSRVLELGAGTGHLTRSLQDLGHFGEIQATDGASEMLSLARSHVPEVLFEHLDYFAPGWFLPFQGVQGVTSSLTFHYHPEKTRLFQEIHALLPPGGALVFADKVAPENGFVARLLQMESARSQLGRHPTAQEVADQQACTQQWNERSGKHLQTVPALLALLTHAGFEAGCLWQDRGCAVLVARKP